MPRQLLVRPPGQMQVPLVTYPRRYPYPPNTMPQGITQFTIRSTRGLTKFVSLMTNLPDGEFELRNDGVRIETKIEGGGVLFELLDPDDVVIELVARPKSGTARRSNESSSAAGTTGVTCMPCAPIRAEGGDDQANEGNSKRSDAAAAKGSADDSHVEYSDKVKNNSNAPNEEKVKTAVEWDERYKELLRVNLNNPDEGMTLKWKERYQELEQYFNEHGTSVVPLKYESNRPLGNWVDCQRRTFKQGKMSCRKVDLLNKVQFNWEIRPYAPGPPWISRYNELVAYHREHGHCNITQNTQLRNWCQTQRDGYRRQKLSEDRIKRLNEINFEWEPVDQIWDERYNQLLEYKTKHGNCLVKRRGKSDNTLAHWVDSQRKQKIKGTLSEERVNKLDAIGFAWQGQHSKWASHYNDLIEFKTKHGHTNVSAKNKQKGFNLYSWVLIQRTSYKEGTLSEERVAKLNAIGFEWGMKDKWMSNYQVLLEYKSEKGDCDVPARHVTENGFPLGQWVYHQRTAYKEQKLSEERIKLLNAVKFSWVRPRGRQKKEQLSS